MMATVIRFDRHVGHGVAHDAGEMREVVVRALQDVDAWRESAQRAPQIVLKDVPNEELCLCGEVGSKDVVHHARGGLWVGALVEESQRVAQRAEGGADPKGPQQGAKVLPPARTEGGVGGVGTEGRVVTRGRVVELGEEGGRVDEHDAAGAGVERDAKRDQRAHGVADEGDLFGRMGSHDVAQARFGARAEGYEGGGDIEREQVRAEPGEVRRIVPEPTDENHAHRAMALPKLYWGRRLGALSKLKREGGVTILNTP